MLNMTLAEIEAETLIVWARMDKLRDARRSMIARAATEAPRSEKVNRLIEIFPSMSRDAIERLDLSGYDVALIQSAFCDSGRRLPEGVDLKAVAEKIRAEILSRPPEALAWVTTAQLAEMVGAWSETVVDAAATILERESDPIISKFWVLPSADGDVIEVPNEDVAAWRRGEGLAHPETGDEIADPDLMLQHVWAASPRGAGVS